MTESAHVSLKCKRIRLQNTPVFGHKMMLEPLVLMFLHALQRGDPPPALPSGRGGCAEKGGGLLPSRERRG